MLKNAYWDGTYFVRGDATLAALMLYLADTEFQFRYAGAGSGAISWSYGLRHTSVPELWWKGTKILDENFNLSSLHIPASLVDSERFGMARMPDGTSGYVLTAKGSGVNPAYEAGHNRLHDITNTLDHDSATSMTRIRAYVGTNQNIANNTYTRIAFDTETYDTLGEFNVSTNRFTVTKAGYYLILFGLKWTAATDQSIFQGLINVNGSYVSHSTTCPSGTAAFSIQCTDIQLLAVNDYVEIYAYQNSGSTKTIQSGSFQTWVCIHRLL